MRFYFLFQISSQVSVQSVGPARGKLFIHYDRLALKVLVTTVDAQWEGMGDVGSARYKPAVLPPCPTIRVLTYSN